LSRFALIKAVLGPIMRLMFRPQVEGAEHIPATVRSSWPATT
jgi:1-acyl-sn-glycerol-3-phosphate acyltransferase